MIHSGLHQDSPEYRDFVGPDWHIRVLSIPLEQEGKRLATLQIASRLDVVDAAQDDLTEILSIIWIVAVLFSGMAVWVTMGQTLKPLGGNHRDRGADQPRRRSVPPHSLQWAGGR